VENPPGKDSRVIRVALTSSEGSVRRLNCRANRFMPTPQAGTVGGVRERFKTGDRAATQRPAQRAYPESQRAGRAGRGLPGLQYFHSRRDTDGRKRLSWFGCTVAALPRSPGLLTLLMQLPGSLRQTGRCFVNHRLNLFGYCIWRFGARSMRIRQCGLLDVIAALEVVRDTSLILAESSERDDFRPIRRRLKISHLLAMPGANGLFHKAIIESGSALKGNHREDANKTAERFLPSWT